MASQERKPSIRGRPLPKRHVSAASLDTNASGIAESTISLGLSRFPEPPASIPTTPLGSNFQNSSPRTPTFNNITPPPTAPLRTTPRQLPRQGPPPTTYARYTDHIPSLPQSSNASTVSAGDFPSSASQISPYDWHDGASSIDVDAAEERLLPTSFITTLLRENKPTVPRRPNRNSYAPSEAFSGISEMTYPPAMSQAEASRAAPVRPLPQPRLTPNRGAQPPSAFSPLPDRSQNRMSGDSETLHSAQGYPSIVRVADSRSNAVPENHVTPAVHHATASASASQISSTVDGDTIRSMDKGYQRNLSTTYEMGDELEYKGYSNQDYSPALASTAGLQGQFFKDPARNSHGHRASVHSSKSVSPSFLSRVSSLRRVFGKKRGKPLPPVPTIPDIPLAFERAHRQQDQNAPLPDLIDRAGALQELLEKGQRPYDSTRSLVARSFHGFNGPAASYGAYEAESLQKSEYQDSHYAAVSHRSSRLQMSGTPSKRITVNKTPRVSVLKVVPSSRKRRMCIIITITIILIAAIAAIGAGVGIAVGKKKGSGFDCTGNSTGSACNIDATCVCTSTTQCNPLAQSVINQVPVVNQFFLANYTSTTAYSSIWLMQSTPSSNNCASQALLLDPGSGLNAGSFPNRTQWVQAALLWHALQTEDSVASQKMQKSVQNLPWKNLQTDGAVAASSSFAVTASGYTFNFASQTVSQPPASFVTLGQPSNAQLTRVSTNAQATLDRMYTFAQASSTQRQNALQKYWTSVLLQHPQDLSTFKSAFSVSPVMLPFNASSRSIRNLYTSSPTSPFPPPLSCYPGLNPSLFQQVNSIESHIYGLPSISSAQTFDPNCYHDRPIYGVLDVLRLRLPFLDSRTGVVKQSAVLTRDASSRVILYNGELFSAALNGTVTITPSQLDPRQYGTLGVFDHVILQYLTSMPSISIATALVQFILATATTTPIPPDASSLLFQSLNSLPVIEVAVFGDVGPSDLISTVTPFTTPSGSLLFGSDDGNALRTWTINSVNGPVVWTQNATSPVVVRDKSFSDAAFTQTWNAASTAIINNIANIGLSNITDAFTNTHEFSP